MTRFDSTRIWVNKWGRIIFGAWLLSVSLYLIPVSLNVRATGQKQEQLASEASLAAGINCWRTKVLGPYSVRDAARRDLYPPALLAWAGAAIPKSCPAIPDRLKPPTP